MTSHPDASSASQPDAFLDQTDAALEAAVDALTRTPRQPGVDARWQQLIDRSGDAGAFALQRRCLDAQYALRLADPERAGYRAWDQAQLAILRGRSHLREGDSGQAHAEGTTALHRMLDDGGTLSFNDCLALARDLARLVPERMGFVAAHIRALRPAGMAPANRRDLEIRIARLEANAQFRLGRLDLAIARAREGRYGTYTDSDDNASAVLLDWLMEAGLTDDAAALAFESAFNERPVSSGRACALAREQLDLGSSRNPYWPLTLAYAAGPDTQDGYLQLARERAPGHRAIDAAQGLRLLSQQDTARALPLLEAAVRDPALANSDVVPKLWLCRMRVHGVAQALAMPFIDSPSAAWCYGIAMALMEATRQQLPEHESWPGDAVAALATRYDEQALVLFERFFETGSGMFRDAHIRLYAILCCKLANRYRALDPFDARIPVLHEKGLAVIPFGEQHEGLLQYRLDAADSAGIVDAAQRLWDFAGSHPSPDHRPAGYIGRVVDALLALGRDGEAERWRARLE
ncbi:hypothetical protein F2P45_10365 [Massilia sp. CCM 8733]|uniref:DUF4034 domain-containing protein n=1 Tax=Massilia mucilaginosa TaxID=2609282 RepID=A0ABX0NRI2_9BURK|nr:hypothetical protein [Massilia mucilaginosa]NHZ89416.1 hypothetical protein [Massilia mucilaginosa]